MNTEIKNFEFYLNDSNDSTITISYYLENGVPFFSLSVYDPFLMFNNLDQMHRYFDDYLTGFVYSNVRDFYEDKYNLIDELKNNIKETLNQKQNDNIY